MSDESLFREVDEEVRQDEMKRLWDRHGKWVSALAIAAVAAVAGYEGYKYYRTNQSEQAAVVYFDALKKQQAEKPDDAIAALKAVPAGTGYADLAAIKQAELLASQGKADDAAAAFDALAAKSGVNAVIADIARIKAAYVLVDSKSPADLAARVGAFDKPDSAWRHQAREIMALANYRAKDFAAAKKQIDAITADIKTPPDLLRRTQVLLQLIEPQLQAK